MRFQVPQFVDIEDKIIGPLTLKQFMTYLFTVLMLIPAFIAFDLSLFLTVAIPVLALAALFAHMKPNGKSMFSLTGSAFNFITRGQLFIWQRSGTDKMLPVKGEEYGNLTPLNEETAGLSQRARDLETKGSLVAEDMEDPLGQEAA